MQHRQRSIGNHSCHIQSLVEGVKFQRRYRDQQGNWKTNNSFTMTELPVAIAVLQRAFEYVAAREADEDLS